MNTELKTMTHVEEKQETLAQMVRMVARKQHHALFVVSSGGAGKSRTITRTLADESQDMVLYNSSCTGLQFYRLLFENRENESVLFFDDCDGLYTSPVQLGLLRSALFGQPDRVVTYNSSQLPDDLPSRFETTSRFIFCANQIPKKNPMFDAVLTRCLVYRMELTNLDIIEQFRATSASGYPGVSPHECGEIVDFIEQNGSEKQLSLRLLSPAIRIYRFCTEQGLDWRPMLLAQLQTLGRPSVPTKRNDGWIKDSRLIEQVIRQFPDSSKEQQEEWCRLSKKSRASYFRAMARYREKGRD